MERVKDIQPAERGSALLLTLGVMSLALIMAMAFAFSARTETHIAKVNADLIKARLLAETALNRVMALLSSDTDTLANSFKAVGKESGSPYLWSGKDRSGENKNNLENLVKESSDLYLDWLYKNTKWETNTWSTAGFYSVLDKAPKEEYATENCVSGRMGMIFWDESGKMDFNEVEAIGFGGNRLWATYDSMRFLDKDGYDSTNSGHFLYDLGLSSSAKTAFNPDVLRKGQAVYELRENDFMNKIANGWGGQKTAGSRQLSSYNHMLHRLESIAKPWKIEDISYYSGLEPETFYVKSSTGDSWTEYSRFDITGTEYAGYKEWTDGFWKNITVEQLAAGERKVFDETELEQLTAGSVKVDDYIPRSIPYLKDKLQVCANLKDYCDADDDASVPESFTIDSATPPSYCGNEKAVYFNEFNMLFDLAFSQPPESSNKIKCALGVYPAVELVKIFQEKAQVGPITLRIYFDVEFTDKGASPVPIKPDEKYQEWTIESSKWSFSDTKCGYQKVSCESKRKILDERTFDIPTIGLLKYSVTIHKIVAVMKNGSSEKFLDVSYLMGKNSAPLMPKEQGKIYFYIPSADKVMEFPFSIEAKDPRCNLLAEDWELKHWPSQFLSTAYAGNLDQEAVVNSCFKPQDPVMSASQDREKGIDLSGGAHEKTFSTAFIRNAPMKSFWELGAIHRGAPYQTINLAKFTENQELMGTYENGDGTLLDQIKLGPVKMSRGKINLNRSRKEVLDHLVKGVDNGGPNIAGEMPYDKFVWNSGAPSVKLSYIRNPLSRSRGEICNMISAKVEDLTLSDRELEAYAGKTAQLLGSRFESYTVLAIGQSMSQYDDNTAVNAYAPLKAANKLVNPTEYKLDGESSSRKCSILATRRLLVQLLRDTWKNTFQVIRVTDVED